MITTYDSNCMKCLQGALHPWHDNGTPAEVSTDEDAQFSQLPPEERYSPTEYGTRVCDCGCPVGRT